MNLVDYQEKTAMQIYALLLSDGGAKNINLHGAISSGKTTIAQGVMNMLKEDWMTFYIRGVDPNLSPYLTWHVGTHLHSKNKLIVDSKISFGINTPLIPITLGFQSSIPKFEEKNFILTESEEALIASIEKQASTNKNILFVIDDFELWDIPSKQLLKKIMLSELNILSNYHIYVLLISQKEEVPDSNSLEYINIPIPTIDDKNLRLILERNGYTSLQLLDEIRTYAGNDLSLALMAAEYHKEDGSFPNFNNIMDQRYNRLPEYEQNACSVLESLSIIDSYFSKNETAYFLDISSPNDIELLYKADEYLSVAKDQNFIDGKRNYFFTNLKIKNYFKARLARREKYLHRMFADYLKIMYPEDYFNRGKHLNLSINGNDSNDDRLIHEAWQLLFISYCRRVAELGYENDIYNILPKIEELMQCLTTLQANMQLSIKDSFWKGYLAFSKCNYREALYHLQGINPMQLTSAFRAENQRLIVLCHVQIAENPNLIKKSSEELFDIIQSADFSENEQYCQAALVLLEVYLDRLNEPDKARILKESLIKINNKHAHSLYFLGFSARFNRKAALHFSATIALKLTGESVNFFREHNSNRDLYMALCNHAANAMVSGEYETSNDALTECLSLLDKRQMRVYPSIYKISNNKMLLKYLKNEFDASNDPTKLMVAAKEAYLDFNSILEYQEDEVSQVIYLNHLSFSILSNSNSWPDRVKEANQKLANSDNYYKYYLHDINFAAYLLKANFDAAEKELCILESIDVPLLHSYRTIFEAKRQVQKRYLASGESFGGTAIAYNQAVLEACSHVQDSTSHFCGRGLLLSDLQFLSF